MRKASKILLLIGGILGIVLAITWLVVGIVYLFAGAVAAAAAAGEAGGAEVPQSIIDFINDFVKQHPGLTLEEVAATLLASGVVFVIMFVFAIPAAILSFVARGREKPGLALLIVATALNVFGGNLVSVVGGVLGIVNWAVVDRKQQ